MKESLHEDDCSINIVRELAVLCINNSSAESSGILSSVTKGEDGATITKLKRYNNSGIGQALCSSITVSNNNYNRNFKIEDINTYIILDDKESTAIEDEKDNNTTFSKISLENSFIDDNGVEYIWVLRDYMSQ